MLYVYGILHAFAPRPIGTFYERSSEEPALCLWMSCGIGIDAFSGYEE